MEQDIRMRLPLKHFLFCLAALLAVCARVEAEPDLQSRYKGAVDQFIAVNFPPEEAYALCELGLGELRQFPATLVPRPEEREEYIAGIMLREADLAGSSRLNFSFLLKGEGMSFAATPVRSWTPDGAQKNLVDSERLVTEVSDLQARIKQKEPEVEAATEHLRELRKKASAIAGLDEIVDLRMELARLKEFGEQKTAERDRLKQLIDRGREVDAPADIDARRQELSEHLKDTAKATAMADRLQRRRREAARSTIDKKLALVKEAGRYNAEALAQDVLQLRSRRKYLEERLGMGERQEDF